MKKIIPAEIKIFKNNIDIRDYRLDASKLLALGFKPKKNVEDAIRAGLLNIDQLKENIFFKNIIIELKNKYNHIDDKLLMFQVLRKQRLLKEVGKI